MSETYTVYVDAQGNPINPDVLRIEGLAHPLYEELVHHPGTFVIDGRDFFIHTDQIMALLSKCLIVRTEWSHNVSCFGSVIYQGYSIELFERVPEKGLESPTYIIQRKLIPAGPDDSGSMWYREELSLIKGETT